ncbi:hypothetical protein [Flammeovirga agarivorans]|uniref:Uncharacterized protein n=1 Tax=Flammeovirga agarivorans TaxID=2726742 RepID=A0A7X8SRC6_9BACT|nr:hypothetical protein [Flammeovirga agarivorans]NLR94963.1 hypothetical protein [Flammeovirga agarivorans]
MNSSKHSDVQTRRCDMCNSPIQGRNKCCDPCKKEKIKIYQKKYNAENREVRNLKAREYYQKNKFNPEYVEKRESYQKTYYAKQSTKERLQEYHRTRYATDPIYREKRKEASKRYDSSLSKKQKRERSIRFIERLKSDPNRYAEYLKKRRERYSKKSAS